MKQCDQCHLCLFVGMFREGREERWLGAEKEWVCCMCVVMVMCGGRGGFFFWRLPSEHSKTYETKNAVNHAGANVREECFGWTSWRKQAPCFARISERPWPHVREQRNDLAIRTWHSCAETCTVGHRVQEPGRITVG